MQPTLLSSKSTDTSLKNDEISLEILLQECQPLLLALKNNSVKPTDSIIDALMKVAEAETH